MSRSHLPIPAAFHHRVVLRADRSWECCRCRHVNDFAVGLCSGHKHSWPSGSRCMHQRCTRCVVNLFDDGEDNGLLRDGPPAVVARRAGVVDTSLGPLPLPPERLSAPEPGKGLF